MSYSSCPCPWYDLENYIEYNKIELFWSVDVSMNGVIGLTAGLSYIQCVSNEDTRLALSHRHWFFFFKMKGELKCIAVHAFEWINWLLMNRWQNYSQIFDIFQHVCQPYKIRPAGHLTCIQLQLKIVMFLSPLIHLRKKHSKGFTWWISGNATECWQEITWSDLITINLCGFRWAFYDGRHRVWNNSLDRTEGNLALIISYCSQEVTLLKEIMRQSTPNEIQLQIM